MGNGNSHSSETALSASSKLQHLVVEPDAVVNSSPSDIPRSVSSECPVIRRLILHRNEKLDDVIFVVKKGWNLQFVLGSSLCSSNVRLFLSHQSVGVDEELTQHELTWCKQHSHNVGSLLDDVQVFAETQVLTAGSFYYFFTVNGTDKQEDASGTGYFIVQPELKVGTLRTNIPLCGIVCQTVLSKNLGPFSDWLDRLIVAKKTGYNAIHFTPLQELGDSQSAYALRDLFKLNPSFGNVSYSDIAGLVRYIDEQWSMLSFTDLVLNHIANESEWLAENPQCVYNLVNAPHMKPAFLLDCLLARFSKEIADGMWRDGGLPPEVRTEKQLQLIGRVLQDRIEKLRLWEFYQVDIDRVLADIRKLCDLGLPSDVKPMDGCLTILPHVEYHRLGATVDLQQAAKMLNTDTDDVAGQELCFDDICSRLHRLNTVAETAIRHHLNAAVSNIMHSAWHRFVNVNGERAQAVSCSLPLMNRYFRLPPGYDGATVHDDEALMNSSSAAYCWAHSGWVPDDVVNPLVNFAEPPSNVYLRRELNSWTDSVKLRYGAAPEDCPALWTRAAEYAAWTANVFHGVRLDNCHSTPVHVAEHVLKAARRVRPDLYVFAELFAGGQAASCRMANRLGLNATVEVGLHAHSAWQLMERISNACEVRLGGLRNRQTDWLVGRRRTPAILFDQTHDDASPVQRRMYVDPLPSAAVVCAASSAVGSNRGYDELVPRTISVISERRLYRKWRPVESDSKPADPETAVDSTAVDFGTGLIAVRRALNELHVKLAVEGFDEVGTDMVDDDIVVVTRRCREKQRSVITISHTAFHPRPRCVADDERLKAVEVPGVVDEIHLEAFVASWSPSYHDHDDLIVGLSEYKVDSRVGVAVSDSRLVRVLPGVSGSSCDTVELVDFTAGCVVVLSVSLTSDSVCLLDELLRHFDTWIWSHSSEPYTSFVERVLAKLDERDPTPGFTSSGADMFQQLLNIVSQLDDDESKHVLYETESERRPSGDGFSVYHIPGHGDLSHCGLSGIATLLRDLKRQHADATVHPLSFNLRHGDWLMDYIVGRLASNSGTLQQLSSWLEHVFDLVKTLPRCLVLCYFEAVVSAVHQLVSSKICQIGD